MFSSKVSYPTLVPKYRQFETRSNTGRLSYISFDKPGEINASLNVITYIIDRLKTMSSSSLPALKFGYSERTSKKALVLCSSDEKNSFIPVTRSGFRLLITSAIHDIWYTEFMATGMSLKTLVEEMVANVKFPTSVIKGSSKKTFFTSDSILNFDSMMESFHNAYVSSSFIEFDDEFNKLLNGVYVALLALLGNNVVGQGSANSKIDFTTNDPVAIALVILWDYANVCDSLFSVASRISNDVCKKVSLPFILDTSSGETVSTLYRDYMFEGAARRFRENVNAIKMSELVGFNSTSLALGFNKRARLIMTDMYASQITNLFTTILNTIALESKFRACCDMLFSSSFISASRNNTVVPQELRILAPIYWKLKDNKYTESIKDYDLTSRINAIPDEVKSYVNDLAKFVESLCYIDPEIDDLYSITTVTTEKGPIDSIIRINLVKRLSDPTFVLRSVKLSDNILQSDYRKVSFDQVPYSIGDKAVHIKLANNLNKLNPSYNVPQKRQLAEFDLTVQQSNNCLFVGDIDELREFVSTKSKFYEIHQLDTVSGETVVELRSSCYVIKPNSRYSGVVIGDFCFDCDNFELAAINPNTCSFIELLLSTTHRALNHQHDELLKLYESRIKKLQDITGQTSCIFTARFADYSSTKISASPLNLYLSIKGIDGKTNVNNLVMNAVSAFLEKNPTSDSIKNAMSVKKSIIPVRAVMESKLQFDLQLPLGLLSDDAKYRLASNPNQSINGPLSSKSGEPIWKITLLSQTDPIKGFFEGLNHEELFRLSVNIDEFNTDFGGRSIWRRDDKLLVQYQFEDPDLNDFIKRGSSIAFDSQGVMDGVSICSRYYNKVYKSLLSTPNAPLSTIGSLRISLALNMLKVLLLYVAYRVYDNWSSFEGYDLNSDEIKILKDNINVLSAYLEVVYNPETPLSVFGCPTTVKLEDFCAILDKIAQSLANFTDFASLRKNSVSKKDLLDGISALILKLEGDDLSDLLRYQLIPLPKPCRADIDLIKKLTKLDPIKIVNAPTLADSVSLPGLDFYIGSELVKQIAECCVDFIGSSAVDQLL